jgi:predicted DNA-binding protein (MmcQ/YjbR family)
MNKQELQTKLESYPFVELEFPFGADVEVYKVLDKMFALVAFRNGKEYVNLKAAPQDVEVLIDQFGCISPGYHMNKKHWVTVGYTEEEADHLIDDLVVNSYKLVVSKMTKAQRNRVALVDSELVD